jgi:hypothetical protein
MEKKTEREEMQEPKEAGVGSAVAQARSDLKPVGGSLRAQGAGVWSFRHDRATLHDKGRRLERHVAL